MADTWGWFGNRSSGEGSEFETAATESTWELHDGKAAGVDITFNAAASAWANHDWLGGRGMIMAAESGGGAVTGTASTSQAQTVAGTASLAYSGAASTLQGQSATSSGALGFTGTVSTTQGQTSAAAGTTDAPSITGDASTAQAQSGNISGALSFSGAISTSQAQTASGVGVLEISGAASTAQGQSCLGALEYAAVGRRFKHYAKAYLKRGHEVLVFGSEDEKDKFLDAEIKAKEAIEKAKKKLTVVVKKLPEPAQTVELKGLQQQANRYEIKADIAQILAQQDFERLLTIHAAILEMQDEEDIELLLIL